LVENLKTEEAGERKESRETIMQDHVHHGHHDHRAQAIGPYHVEPLTG
jgi:hypothetical protein